MNSFFLCHPDDIKSCGACCGLYNYENFNRETITTALRFRTDLFRLMQPQGASLEKFRGIVAEADMRSKLLEDIYTCEFLGFTGEAERKVGCLIHPMINGGPDMRDHAYYGAETCAEHRCTAYNYLTEAESRPVIAATDDWYLYGLCITDIDLVKGFYEAVSELRCETLRPEAITESSVALDVFRRYLALKENWPYQRGKRRFGQYIFEKGSYRVADIDWESFGLNRPREARILRSLGSEFKTVEEIQNALRILRELVKETADAIGAVFV